MPLSEHEERILHELERKLYDHDPAFADRVAKETVYRYAGRNCKWAGLGFVIGAIVMVGFFAVSVFLGVLGFLIMLVSAVFFERNMRRIGKAGWHDMRSAAKEKGSSSPLEEGWKRFREKFHHAD